jgi:hypothetical protein
VRLGVTSACGAVCSELQDSRGLLRQSGAAPTTCGGCARWRSLSELARLSMEMGKLTSLSRSHLPHTCRAPRWTCCRGSSGRLASPVATQGGTGSPHRDAIGAAPVCRAGPPPRCRRAATGHHAEPLLRWETGATRTQTKRIGNMSHTN